MTLLLALLAVLPFFSSVLGEPITATREFPGSDYQWEHHDQEDLYQILIDTNEECPEITRIYSAGRSVEEEDLWVIEISDNPGKHEVGEPEFKYIGNMHGNEVVGREMLLLLIPYLCKNYETDPDIKWLVDNTRIHIMPTMNPDGYAAALEQLVERGQNAWSTGRANAHEVDLNRNFPDLDRIIFDQTANRFPQKYGLNNHITSRVDQSKLEPETKAIMSWLQEYPFILSANLHGGDIVANYPYDSSHDGKAIYEASPDDEVFRQVSLAYATPHPVMSDPHREQCDIGGDDAFKHGITNGADWYPLKGGMQDYNYLHTNCFEITIELSCKKFPSNPNDYKKFWGDNKQSLLDYIRQAHSGIKGTVTDENGVGIDGAKIKVWEVTGPASEERYIDHDITTADDGDFWRLLVPGTYKVEAEVCGFHAVNKTCTVAEPGTNVEASDCSFQLAEDNSTEGCSIEDLESFLMNRLYPTY